MNQNKSNRWEIASEITSQRKKVTTDAVVFCVFSRLVLFCEKRALRNFTKFSGKHLCQSLYFNIAV